MVSLPLNDYEATELEYAIKHRLNCLLSPASGCQDCIKGDCTRHANMVGLLQGVLLRLVGTGFSLKS